MIDRIVISPEIRSNPLAASVSEKLGIKPEYLTKEELIEETKNLEFKESFKNSKKTLFFTENKGKMLKKCPGSKGVLCCNYFTINSVSGCPFDCSYCILQHYIQNNPFISIFVNRDSVIDELSEFLNNHNHIRVGTGELADSLALDPLIDESGFFLKAIRDNGWENKITFEFKTKSAEVDGLIENYKKYQGLNVVAGFSVNNEQFNKTDEIDTASIDARLAAAKKCSDAGMRVAIHFDPVIMLDENMLHYMQLIDKIFGFLDPKSVAWISMGGFRHTLSLGSVIEKRFPQSNLLQGEMFPSDRDNKLRYLSTIRRRFYKAFKDRIESYIPNPPLYLCMEKYFMWQDTGMECRNLPELFS